MSEELQLQLAEEELYGKWVEADPDVVMVTTTINPKFKTPASDAFTVEAMMVQDENTTLVKVRHAGTKERFLVTWTYQEEEDGTNGE